MRRIILLSSFIFILLSVKAQVQTRVIGDSVFMQSNTGKSELILQNSTDSITGFLFNRGEGRTEFRKALIKINDSIYLVGTDSLRLNNGGSNDWKLSGNRGTNSLNFIGTTDNQPLYFKVNNNPAGILGSNFNNSFGLGALQGNTTGFSNTAIGYYPLWQNTTGIGNSAVGYKALNNNTSGIRNVAVGYEALFNNTSGSYNIGLGFGFYDTNRIASNTFYISDSTYHMKFKLDSAAGVPPSVIGKDHNGYWHVYQTPVGGSTSAITLTTTGTSGAATLTGQTFNVPVYSTPLATKTSAGIILVGNGLAIDSTGTLSTTTGLFKLGSVPYAGPNGTLVQDTTGLVYDGNNLQVGRSDFYNTVGLALNGGRAKLAASGFGLTISTSGGQPMDASKSISFFNSSTLYAKMSMRSVSDSTLRFLSYMEFVPGVTNKFNLGALSNQWDNVYTRNLYINGTLFSESSQVSISGTATLSAGSIIVMDNKVRTGAKIFVSCNTPSGTQGFLSAPTSAIIDGTSFAIYSTSNTDNSTVNYQIINP